ncbi:MAG: hypothetical protein H6797_03470 [Candidatus Nomurabacteria bacterium]|nr:MAG: hypothetical protein H6797_03470 [Candidatus Nomurabacteria bacterium]
MSQRKEVLRKFAILFVLVAVVIYGAVFGIMRAVRTPSVARASGGSEMSGWVTFYSVPDNDPPGSRKISYSGPAPRHARAGGTGTYDDPQTFATAHPDVYPTGTRIYVPRFQRYFVMEDLCACSHGANHVDLWLEPSGTNAEVLACENALTAAGKRQETIIKDPDPNMPVDLRPLMSNGACRVP